MNPKPNISAKTALDLIEEKGKINDVYIERSLVIEDKEFSNSVELTNCIVSDFSAALSTFS
jgi:hypothetical protein